jgi:hypothetical protein
VGALANYIERAGVATASISLIREQSEAVRPPRALWVPFDLGRPLGTADDPAFQKGVLRAALGMLATSTEPTIEDYPLEAPDKQEAAAWVCPVSFPIADDESLLGRLRAEVARLAPWAAETRKRRGRTLFGVTGASPDQVDAVARALVAVAESGDLAQAPASDVAWQFEMPLLVRHLADDLRTYYHEALAAQPGSGSPDHNALNDWIFGQTALGDVLQAIAGHLTADGTPMALLVRKLLIPEGRLEGPSGWTGIGE